MSRQYFRSNFSFSLVFPVRRSGSFLTIFISFCFLVFGQTISSVDEPNVSKKNRKPLFFLSLNNTAKLYYYCSTNSHRISIFYFRDIYRGQPIIGKSNSMHFFHHPGDNRRLTSPYNSYASHVNLYGI